WMPNDHEGVVDLEHILPQNPGDKYPLFDKNSTRVYLDRLERSEKMRLGVQQPQADQGTGEAEEGLVDLREPIPATPPSAERMPPGNGPLDEPAEHPQAAAVFGIPCGPHGRDPQPAQPPPHRL